MPYDPNRHHRRSIRLKGYDYRQAGLYFVTICTHDRLCLFGEIVDGEMILSEWGRVAREEWLQTAKLRPHMQLDQFQVMPNHTHGIIWIVDGLDGRGTARRAPTPAIPAFGNPIARSLPTIIGAFKSAVTKRINQQRGTPGSPVWQRNYHEHGKSLRLFLGKSTAIAVLLHIIRNERDLQRIRAYIAANSAQWDQDPENPHHIITTTPHVSSW